MIFAGVLILNIVVLIAYIRAKKNLHFYEIILYWMTLSFIFQDIVAILELNLRVIVTAKTYLLYWSIVLNRMILYPLILTWFLDAFAGAKSAGKRAMLLVVFLFILSCLGLLGLKLGLITYVTWKPWHTFVEWFSLMLLGLILLRYFRRLLKKEVLT